MDLHMYMLLSYKWYEFENGQLLQLPEQISTKEKMAIALTPPQDITYKIAFIFFIIYTLLLL